MTNDKFCVYVQTHTGRRGYLADKKNGIEGGKGMTSDMAQAVPFDTLADANAYIDARFWINTPNFPTVGVTAYACHRLVRAYVPKYHGPIPTRPVCAAYGCEADFALRALGWTGAWVDGGPGAGVWILTPPGYRPPVFRKTPRARGERAPADRR